MIYIIAIKVVAGLLDSYQPCVNYLLSPRRGGLNSHLFHDGDDGDENQHVSKSNNAELSSYRSQNCIQMWQNGNR